MFGVWELWGLKYWGASRGMCAVVVDDGDNNDICCGISPCCDS